MGQSLPTVQDLPTVLELLQRYPFGSLILLVAGWLVVQGIKAWRAAMSQNLLNG